ncbi:MAG: hypothetical protein QME51_00675 [Planctomycetota bacterium]|nr:hypothetical protein [Planctomycetota bacterium]MDI6786873.1 hypothetical protein [Planctomycetota bacterium]
MRLPTILFIITAFLTGISQPSPTAIAQEQGTKETGKTSDDKPKKPEASAYVRYRQMEIWKEDGFQFTSFTNKVELYQAGKILKADTLIARNKIKEEKEPKDIIFDEVYAEGNIKIISENDFLFADRFYYNFTNNTGIIINAEIRSSTKDSRQQELVVVIRANIAYQINKSTLVAGNASITTCSHGEPHYHFWAHRVSFITDESGKHITIHHLIPHIAGIPVFYMPYYKKTLGTDSILRSIRFSKSSRLGRSTDVRFGLNINKYFRDAKGEIEKNEDGSYKTRRWGDLTLDTHFYEKRGTALEPELEYNWQKYSGLFKNYYIQDKGPDLNQKYARSLYKTQSEIDDVSEEERGRLHIYHRQQLNQNVRADAELYYLSDRYFLPEFFNKEYKEQKQPESYLYVRYLRYNTGAVLLGQPDLTNFQDETLYQPKLATHIISKPFYIFSDLPFLYYTGSLEIAHLKRQDDKDPFSPDYQLTRLDMLNEVSAPFPVGFIKVTPFVSARWTAYEKTIKDDNFSGRFVGSEGIRLFTQFYRSFDLKQTPLGISNPTHTVSLDLRYTQNSYVTVSPSDLFFFDNTDRYEKLGEGYIEVRNRFKSEQNGKSSEFLNVGLSLERYSRPVSNSPANYLYPMNWLTLSPVKQKDFPERRTSNLNLDVLLTPFIPFSFRTVWQYNTHLDRGEIWYFNMNFIPYSLWSISLYGTYIIDETDSYGLRLTCSPIEKWELSISDQYDFREQKFIDRRYSLRRDLHDFFIAFVVNIDRGKDENNFNITISPKNIREGLAEIR